MRRIYISSFLMVLIVTAISVQSCDNLFSPKLDETQSSSIITDQKTIDGVFQNFKYAYTFKDTSVYGGLLTDNFLFMYRDYETGFDVTWDKPVEMKTTNGLFQNAQKLDIIWNNIVVQTGDSVAVNVKRSFNLTITFNPSNIIRLYGFADMNFFRTSQDDKWRIIKWRDESF